eukprot:CAMPEP_0183367290 /NCGR_PEP_ID=MMETSP0164_2-20130417/91947_1 /TAXON_ID=221442 /ORGANISM="Coccolithus pelagicus ssp braarudi, Strain PLY182g" /LENGTH=43 /DNA_ID= /DNA_START= /DNA_END= /DNA_ORIENTATION=
MAHLQDMSDDTLLIMLSNLGTLDQLTCGCVCKSLRFAVGRLCD